MPYAIIDDSGVVTTLYHDAPPPEAVEVPKGVVCGWVQVDGDFRAPAISLERRQDRAVERINATYRQHASKTAGVPYAAKHDEALEVSRMEDDGDKPNDMPFETQTQMFPRLAASIGIESDTLTEAANLILKRYTEDAKREGELERARLSGANQVKAATSSAEIDAASSEAIQALEAVGNERSG